jgi:Rod binding domain-containing protein
MYIEDVRKILSLKESDREKLRTLADEFEAIFWGIIMKEMRASVEALSPNPSSFALSTYYSWYDEELAGIIGRANNSLSDLLYKELVKSLK